MHDDRRLVPATPTMRESCARCLRPVRLCWCAHLVSLETRTRVVLLQHPRERHVAIGTARMASLCLPSSELHVGVDWSGSAALARALSDPSRPPALLYPGEGAIDVVAHPPPHPVTLVVVDGTWHHARKLVRSNPLLEALPRYAFRPPAPSEYRIRREPDASFVSTLEALVHVLGVLEGDPARFRAMLAPFRAMIDAQIECERTFQCHRHRKVRRRAPRPDARAALRARERDVVCVIGEANAWARRAPPEQPMWPDELVQWVAHRVSTGETFEAIVAPRQPIGPGTAMQIGVPEALLRAGERRADAVARWREFVRDDDLVCAWGTYATTLMQTAGGYLPPARVDLRSVARAEERGNVGSPVEHLARLRAQRGVADAPPPAPLGLGRAGARLAYVAEIVRELVTQEA